MKRCTRGLEPTKLTTNANAAQEEAVRCVRHPVHDALRRSLYNVRITVICCIIPGRTQGVTGCARQ